MSRLPYRHLIIAVLAVAMPVQAMAATVDVHSYGAVGNGVADDTSAIQNAINACPAGGTVVFTGGTYRLSRTLNLPANTSYLGQGAPVLQGYRGFGNGAFLIGYAGDPRNISVSGIIFDGGGLAFIADSTPGSGIAITNNIFRNIENSNNVLDGFVHQAVSIDGMAHVSGISVTHNTFQNMTLGGDYAIYWLNSINSDWGGTALHIARALNYDITDNLFDHLGANAIKTPPHDETYARPGPYNIQRNVFSRIHRIAVEIQDGYAGCPVNGLNVADNFIASFINPFWGTMGLSLMPWSAVNSAVRNNTVLMTPGGPTTPVNHGNGDYNFAIGIEMGLPIADGNIIQSTPGDTGPAIFMSVAINGADIRNNRMSGPTVSREPGVWYGYDGYGGRTLQPATLTNNSYTPTVASWPTPPSGAGANLSGVSQPVPVVASFSAGPGSIVAGQSTTLSWSVTGATSLSLDNGIGAVTGATRTVTPSQTTTYTLTASNASGPTSRSTTVTVTAASDTTPPTVAMTAPGSGATVSGAVSLTANASDNVGVAGVTFLVDGAVVGSEDTSAPYGVSWATNAVANGSHALTAIARDAAGNRTTSTALSVTVSNPDSTGTIAIDAGGSAVGAFAADNSFSGGNTWTCSGLTFTTAGVRNPAPASVYNTERWGNFTYTITGLPAGSARTVRLHFAEGYWTSPGKRLFDVAINGATVLTKFDIYAASGGTLNAIVREFPATANAWGVITIVFTTVVDNAKVCAIEVVPASPGIVSGLWYKVMAKHSGKLLSVAGSGTADGANVWQWTDDGTTGQQWRIDAVGDGSYTLTARCSGKLLDVEGISTVAGANVHQWVSWGGANQRWRIDDMGSGWYRLTSVNSGKVLDVSGVSTADGANVQQWTDLGGGNQRWSLVAVAPTGPG